MSDFPRGWTLAADNAGGAGAASITVAAVAGVVHVLDAFSAKMINNGAAAEFAQILLSSSDGVFVNLPLGRLIVDATQFTSDSASGSGLDLAAGPGASLTIAFSMGVANLVQSLMIQGHDI